MYGWLRTGAAIVAAWTALAVSAREPAPAAAETAAAPVTRLLVHSGLAADTLERQYPERIRWLEAGDTGPFPALWFPALQPETSGALVLMADEGQSAGTGLVVAIARMMAEAGWAVLTLGLEAPSASVRALLESPLPPVTEKTEAPSVMTDMAVAPDPLIVQYRERVQQQLTAALSWVAGQGYSAPVLAGVGRAAFQVLDTASGGSMVRTRVWILPGFYAGQEAGLAQWLTSRQGEALLELYPSDGDVRGRERWVAARRAGFAGYERQPVALTVPAGAEAAQMLANRILAWLQALPRR